MYSNTFLLYEYTPENQIWREDCIKIYCPCVKKIPTLGYRIHSTSHIYSTVFTYNTATSCVFLDSAGRCRRLPDLPPSADFQHYIYPYPPGYSAVLFSDASLVTSPIFPSTPLSLMDSDHSSLDLTYSLLLCLFHPVTWVLFSRDSKRC